jgi:hypothetical protein
MTDSTRPDMLEIKILEAIFELIAILLNLSVIYYLSN